MNERPILFSGEMVRAILDGRKSQTRRVIKPQPHPEKCVRIESCAPYDGSTCFRMLYERDGGVDVEGLLTCPCGVPGDRLWVRESWWHCPQPRLQQEMVGFSDGVVKLRRGCTVLTTPAKEIIGWGPAWKHKPSIFMPRWASRITLEITKVRVERVKDISEGDAIAEGVKFGTYNPGECRTCARGAYMDLWNHINEKRGFGWNKNPWVWVIEFKRVSGAIG